MVSIKISADILWENVSNSLVNSESRFRQASADLAFKYAGKSRALCRKVKEFLRSENFKERHVDEKDLGEVRRKYREEAR